MEVEGGWRGGEGGLFGEVGRRAHWATTRRWYLCTLYYYNSRLWIFLEIFGVVGWIFLDIFHGYLGKNLWISWPTSRP